MEYCNDSEWKNICDNGFLEKEVIVACRQLGFSGNFTRKFTCSNNNKSNTVYSTAFAEVNRDVFGRGTNDLIQRIWLCSGTEDRLSECRTPEHDICGADPNDARQVAGLYCFGKVFNIAAMHYL